MEHLKRLNHHHPHYPTTRHKTEQLYVVVPGCPSCQVVQVVQVVGKKQPPRRFRFAGNASDGVSCYPEKLAWAGPAGCILCTVLCIKYCTVKAGSVQ